MWKTPLTALLWGFLHLFPRVPAGEQLRGPRMIELPGGSFRMGIDDRHGRRGVFLELFVTEMLIA